MPNESDNVVYYETRIAVYCDLTVHGKEILRVAKRRNFTTDDNPFGLTLIGKRMTFQAARLAKDALLNDLGTCVRSATVAAILTEEVFR